MTATPMERRGRLISRGWVQAVGLVSLFGFSVLGFIAARTYQAEPPIPERVVSATGELLFTGEDVRGGQEVFLRNGIMQYGSIFGHGAYLGPDFTADYLHRAAADVEPRSVYHYLSFLTTPAPLTMFRGVFKMPAGCRAFVKPDGSMKAEAYWDALPGRGDDLHELSKLSGKALREYAVRRTQQLFAAAVEKRLMSDVPFGVLLSIVLIGRALWSAKLGLG